jgi:hypothetical protein
MKPDMASLEKNIRHFKVEYNKRLDILTLQSDEQVPAVSYDCNGLFWLRVVPDTGEIIGVEIEDFERVFLKKFQEFHKSQRNRPESYVAPISREVEACFA